MAKSTPRAKTRAPDTKKPPRTEKRSQPSAAPSNIDRRRTAAQSDGSEAYMQRRAEIVQAAATVFKERGFRGTALSHVAEALGIDRATLYYYVGGKDELFHAAVTGAVRKNLAEAEAEAAQTEPGRAPERLRRLMESVMQSYGANYPFLYVMLQENLSHMAPEHSEWANEIRTINRRWEALIVDIVRQGQEEGTIVDDKPAWLMAYGVIGMLGWTNRWFNPSQSPLSAVDIGRMFADMVLAGIERRP